VPSELPLESFFATSLGLDVVTFRLALASLLGAVIGLDREWRARPAGLRTHILVGLAAATFSVITLELMARASGPSNRTDPIRVVEAVTAGVAFLAAGTIIQARGKVHGLTTGAGLWLAGAIGTAAGIGVYPVAVLATLFGLIVLSLLRWLEKVMPKKHGDSDDKSRPDPP
jgi:putative Mg2+ transporter-C (MgtC) family protein